MKMLEKNKGIILAVILLGLAIFTYNLFFRADAVFEEAVSPISTIGDDILKMRSDLEAISFDEAIFASPAFLLLRDFTVPVPIAPTGRVNPFAPIGQN